MGSRALMAFATDKGDELGQDSWVRSPFSHLKSLSQPQLSWAPGNAEELWDHSDSSDTAEGREKLSGWRLIPPIPCHTLFILTIQAGDGSPDSWEQTPCQGFAL